MGRLGGGGLSAGTHSVDGMQYVYAGIVRRTWMRAWTALRWWTFSRPWKSQAALRCGRW